MRRKASEEGSLPPLKLVVMSATLKVEDFTNNTRLFPRVEDKPALVTVPGRTYPVSIHHSKVTEVDDYGKLVSSGISCMAHCASISLSLSSHLSTCRKSGN
jgi:HrpA-like RNA helicase